jgi:hypothetical protein
MPKSVRMLDSIPFIKPCIDLSLNTKKPYTIAD